MVVVVRVCSPSIWKVEVGARGLSTLHSKTLKIPKEVIFILQIVLNSFISTTRTMA